MAARRFTLKSRRGATYVIGVVCLMMGLVFAQVMISTASRAYFNEYSRMQKMKAMMLAEAGIEHAFYMINLQPEMTGSMPRQTLPYVLNNSAFPMTGAQIGTFSIDCQQNLEGGKTTGWMNVSSTGAVTLTNGDNYSFTMKRRVEAWPWHQSSVNYNGNLDGGWFWDYGPDWDDEGRKCPSQWRICYGNGSWWTSSYSSFLADYVWSPGGGRWVSKFGVKWNAEQVGLCQGVSYGYGGRVGNNVKLAFSASAWPTTNRAVVRLAALTNPSSWFQPPNYGYSTMPNELNKWNVKSITVTTPSYGSGWIGFYIWVESVYNTSEFKYAYFNYLRVAPSTD